MTPRLVPCLVQLRAEFDQVLPGRDRASDGWIGDQAHAARDSDHNPDSRGLVHAIDVDADLRTLGVTMQDVVDHLVARRDPRLTYVIYNRRIWSASRGWAGRPYDGPNPHDKHAHVSAGSEPAREADTSSWDLEDLMALTEEQTRTILREELRAWAKVDPLASIFARTGYLANTAVPALAASVASLDTADIDEQELAVRLAALIPDGLAQRVADELAARLAS